jgi:hypothetical protein
MKIREPKQPMLVSRPKKKNRKSGDDILIYLVPELCCMTGLTDNMRANPRLMQDLDKFTRLAPSQRVEWLQKFYKLLKTQREVSLSNQSCAGSIFNHAPESCSCHISVMLLENCIYAEFCFHFSSTVQLI